MLSWKMSWRPGVVCLLLLMVLFGAVPTPIYAEGGDGSGNTSGVFKPLGLVSVTLEDGTNVINGKDIPLKPKFTFHFDKNVVYLLYWKRNVDCFHLYDDKGKDLAINVTKIDDTVDFSKRQYIWVEPAKPLSSGTTYKFFVSPDLLAKNGGSTLAMTTNGKGETFTFKTAGEKAAEKPTAAAPTTKKPAAAPANSSTKNAAVQTPSQNTGDKKTAVSTQTKTQEKTQDKAQSKTEDKTEDKTQDKNQSNAEDKNQDKIEDKTQIKEGAEQSTNEKKDGKEVLAAADTKQETKSEAKTEDQPEVEKKVNPSSNAKAAEAAANFEKIQQGMKMQNYIGGAGAVAIAGWLVFEIIRRKRK